MAEETQRELTDIVLSEITGWAVRTVQKHRLALEKANWFRKYTIVDNRDKFSVTYYLLDKDTIVKDMDTDEFIALVQESMDDVDDSVVKDVLAKMKMEVEEKVF